MHQHPSVMPCRVLIADSDASVRAALRLLLARQPDFRVVGESRDLEELLEQADTSQPDVILLDWELPGLRSDGHSAPLPGPTSVVLSTRDEQRNRALASGAAAFVCKGESPSRLLETLREVHRLIIAHR